MSTPERRALPRGAFPALVLAIVSLAGCGSSSSPVASAHTSTPTPTTDEPYFTMQPMPTRTEPVRTIEIWHDQAEAEAGVARFLAELDAADRYDVERVEEAEIDGQTITTTYRTVVDVAAARVLSVEMMTVSDEAMWDTLAQSPDSQLLRDIELRTVFDYSGSAPRIYTTYSGDAGWDGKWLDVSAGAPGVAGDAMRNSSTGVHVAGLLAVLALEPTSFDEKQYLLYDVPADIAAGFIPSATSLALQNAGVDVFALPSIAYANVYPTLGGGMEIYLDVAWLLRDAVELLDDSSLAEYVARVNEPVTVRVDAFGTEEPIELPDPAAIVTEPPTT